MNLIYDDLFHDQKALPKEPCHIELSQNVQGSLFLSVTEDQDLTFHLAQGSNLKLFLYHLSAENISVRIQMDIEKDAVCKMAWLDMQDCPIQWEQKVCLNGTGANFDLLSSTLCVKKAPKKANIEIVHQASHTDGIMRHFAVLDHEARFEMVANGNIHKGCIDASSHQATRVLTLGKGHQAKVIPLLLIDENHVKASHALSIGQPDSDQLYYLQSRGLSYQQALGLLSIGYFLPILEYVEDEKKEELRQAIESKVGLYGH